MTEQVQRKRMKTKDKGPRPSKPKQSLRVPLTVAGCVILLALSPWVVYLNYYQPDNGSEFNLELEHHFQEVIENIRNYIISNTTALVQKNSVYNYDIEELQKVLNDNVARTLAVNYQPYFISKHALEITVVHSVVELEPMYRNTLDLNRYPRISDEDNKRLEAFTTGDYFVTSVPFSYRVKTELYLTGKQLERDNANGKQGETQNRIILIDEVLRIPHLFIEYKLQQFQTQTTSEFSDLSRMMNYMLTTLARLRVYTIKQFGSEYSYKNIVNEGDVELCLNLALILEQALLFRAYDKESLDAIDNYFYQLNSAKFNTNPTGKRQWGNAEFQNYQEYISRRLSVTGNGNRLISTLIMKYAAGGYIDPADLVALYLVLDKSSIPAVIDSPKDSTAILQERYDTNYLMDPRTLADNSDTTNLKFILNFPDDTDEGFNFTGGLYDEQQYQTIEFSVDQQPNYQVLGADFKATGLDDPRAWYTSATLRESIRMGSGTRTQSVVPEPPNDHDYRLEWDINVQGKLTLMVKTRGMEITPWLDNTCQQKIIDIDIPVNIYVWSYSNPILGALDFLNLNTGATVAGGWAITSESHLLEYFESNFWKYIKPFAELGFDQAYTILPLAMAHQGAEYFDPQKINYLNQLLPSGNSITSNWLSDILLFQTQSIKQLLRENLNTLWNRLEIFMADYFLDYLGQYDEEYDFFNFTSEPQFPYPPLMPWLSVLGYEVFFHYSKQTNVLTIKFEHKVGAFEVIIDGYDSSPEQLTITLRSHLDIAGVINLTTTITSSDISTPLGQNRPGIFADGALFDKYELTTRTYFLPSEQSSSGSVPIETNERNLFTRAKFGKLYPFAELKLPALSLGSEKRDLEIKLTFIVPAEHKETVTGLSDELQAGLLSDKPELDPSITSDSDEFLADRIYLTHVFSELNNKLQAWLGSLAAYPGLAVDLSISSEQFQDFTNLTIFMTDVQSTRNFINWLGSYGLNLMLVMSTPAMVIHRIADLLTRENPIFTRDDLALLDFEVYNRVLDHEMQKGMGVNENLRGSFKSPTGEPENFTLLIPLSGLAIIIIADGIELDTDNNNANLVTSTQAFYSYQPGGTEPGSTHLLLGTSWLLKSE
ncbi:hypothetical protein [[Eubacterium] cellulosolvens]